MTSRWIWLSGCLVVAAGATGYYAGRMSGPSADLAHGVTGAKGGNPPITLICISEGMRTIFSMDFSNSIILSAEISTEEYTVGNWSEPRPLYKNIPFTKDEATISWIWTKPGEYSNYYYLDRNTLSMRLVAKRPKEKDGIIDSSCKIFKQQI